MEIQRELITNCEYIYHFPCLGERGLRRWAVKLSPCHPELVSGSDQPQIPKQVRNDNLSRRCLCLV